MTLTMNNNPIALASICGSLVLTGCATVAPPSAPAPTAPAAAAATATAPTPAPSAAASTPTGAPSAAARPPTLPGALLPFAEVTRGAVRSEGWLPVWTRDDKTWIEIPAALLDKPFFFGSSISGGLGERGFFPGLTGAEKVLALRRSGNTVQLVARNLHARAPEGTPLARAVAESYSESLYGSAPLAAAPHAASKALLVDAQLLFGGDLLGMQTRLEMSYRLPYALDRAHSSIERARALPTGLHLTVRQHYAMPRLPLPPVAVPGAPPPNPAALPNPPGNVPDPRSLFIGLTYTFAPLPAQPMKTRAADSRVGYFTTNYLNFGDDKQEGRRTHLIERWRLEKKDPAAAVSDPKEPIRVVLDRNVPQKWRAPLREAALEWNKAFERAGFSNALVVEQQPADADWTTIEGNRVLAVRWYAQDGPGSVAIGPSQSDPRTGEILRGAALIDENRVRVFRARAADSVPRWADTLPAEPAADFANRHRWCDHAEHAFDEAAFGYELLVERGLLDPDGPEAERYIAGALKNVTMHEIGHVLGLRHNFRGSTTVTAAQLRDRAFTAANGLSSTVMEYHGQNLPLEGEPAGDYNMLTLGAYDYWAIEYGYREYADAAAEASGLKAVLARAASDPRLVYGPDEDLANNDPRIHQRDLGENPLAFAERELKLARELLRRTTTRALAPDEDLSAYRRAVSRVLVVMGTALPIATKHVGGNLTERVMAGANKPLVQPVPAAQQREALALVAAELFGSASFKFEPRVMARLGVDQFERSAGPNRANLPNVDWSLPNQVLTLQRGALDNLMSDALAGRLADAETRVEDPRALLGFAEVQQRLSDSIWSELGAAGAARAIEIDSLRRNLQREHLKRLATVLVRPASTVAADVRPVMRQAALALQARLSTALASAGGKASSALVRAHLDDSLATLTEALKAPLVKQGA
jgi:hypothetical protein